jgi:hypothetical protein
MCPLKYINKKWMYQVHGIGNISKRITNFIIETVKNKTTPFGNGNNKTYTNKREYKLIYPIVSYFPV